MATAQPDAQDALGAPYPSVATSADLRDVLAELGRRTDLVIRVDEAVEGGPVSVNNAGGTVGTMLDAATAQGGGAWWSDGLIVHVEPQDGLTTRYVPSRGLSPEDVRAQMRRLGLLDARFPIVPAAEGALLRVSGPLGYVAQVEMLVQALIDARRARTAPTEEAGAVVPRVFYGRPM